VVAAAAVAASVFCGDGVFSAVASSLPLLLLLLLVPQGGRVFEGTATGDDAAGGTGASCLLLPEERGADVLVHPPLPEGNTVRDLGFLHPYTTTPLKLCHHLLHKTHGSQKLIPPVLYLLTLFFFK